MSGHPGSQDFTFRFVTRGAAISDVTRCSVHSLSRCHPGARIVMVDANDRAILRLGELPANCRLIHHPPGGDPVADVVGRGSRVHMFYWRYSDELRSAVGLAESRFDALVDADLLFLRPLALGDLVPHLEQGRIAMAIDRATLTFCHEMEPLSADPDTSLFPSDGSRGPMVNCGMLFRNPADDGGILEKVWDLACAESSTGWLDRVPWHDQTLVTRLLGHGGPLWGRLLPLGNEWNSLTHAENDRFSVFTYAAHYGGGTSIKRQLIRRYAQIFPVLDAAGAESLDLSSPFCVTWRIPSDAVKLACSASVTHGSPEESVRLLCYVDGRVVDDQQVRGRASDTILDLEDGECLTLIGISRTRCSVRLQPQWL